VRWLFPNRREGTVGEAGDRCAPHAGRMNSRQRKRDVGFRRRVEAWAGGVPRRTGSEARVASPRERLKPCSQSASARDGACRCPAAGLPAQEETGRRRWRLAARRPPRRMNSLQRERDVGLRRRPVPWAGGVPRRTGSGARVAGPRERLKPCSQGASARDGACRCPSGGFTRSGRDRPTTASAGVHPLRKEPADDAGDSRQGFGSRIFAGWVSQPP
jgi:hypothetical protein